MRLFTRLLEIVRGYRSSKDDGIFSAIKSVFNTKHGGFFIGLTTDIEPRLPHSELHRSRDFKLSINYPLIIFSTYISRRFQTKLKLLIVGWLAKKLELKVGYLTVDGFSHLRVRAIPPKSFLVTFWWNEEQEANDYWPKQSNWIRNMSMVEIFVPRVGVNLKSPKNSERVAKTFNFLNPTNLGDHFPSVPKILFASDITVELRPNLLAYQARLRHQFGLKLDFDEVLWSEAQFRVTSLTTNRGLELNSVNRLIGGLEIHGGSAFPTPTEFDAICLTLFGRERYLYIKAISESEFSDALVLIGESWFQFTNLRKHLISLKRFPSSSKVQLLQKSRVCPDFGSSLGPIPRYLRSEILASRSVGLIQRRDITGNPFLIGFEANRLFGTIDELLKSCAFMMSLTDEEIRYQAKLIRDNYERFLKNSIIDYKFYLDFLMGENKNSVKIKK